MYKTTSNASSQFTFEDFIPTSDASWLGGLTGALAAMAKTRTFSQNHIFIGRH
jgi:hypothetical protein